MALTGTILVNGNPLRGAYVEHPISLIQSEMYMTDEEGRINGGEGIDTSDDEVTIKIHCQNRVARVLDGNTPPFNFGVYQDEKIKDGQVVDLRFNSQQDDHYGILNRLQIAYEVVFRPLTYFQELPTSNFPLGTTDNDLRSTRDQAKRIDVIYPDHSVSPSAWVEPKRLGDNYPLIHLPDRSTESGQQIFGDSGARPVLIPGVLAHALHFSALTDSQRGRAQDQYGVFIGSEFTSGGDGSHDLDEQTTPEVAFIDAAQRFASTFHEFLRQRQGGTSTLVTPEPITTALHAEYVDSQWTEVTEARPPLPAFLRRLQALLPSGLLDRLFPQSRRRRSRRPRFTGGDVMGAVFGAIFVDFAQDVGLARAAGIYFEADALNFGEYQAFVNREYPQHEDALERVRGFWNL